MKYDNLYIVKILIPTVFSLTLVEDGIIEYHLCKREGKAFRDVINNCTLGNRRSNYYNGEPIVIEAESLKNYYNRLGLKKVNSGNLKDEVYKLVAVKKSKDRSSKHI